jgi:hypothetical protein
MYINLVRQVFILMGLLLCITPMQTHAQTPPNPVNTLAVNQNGTLLASGYQAGNVRVTRLSDNTLVAEFSTSLTRGIISSLAWSPINPSILAYVSNNTNSQAEVVIRDISTHQILTTIRRTQNSIQHLGWSADGTRLIGAFEWIGDSVSPTWFEVWAIPGGNTLQRSPNFNETIADMAWSPNGEWIAVTLLDNPGTIQVFNADNLSVVQTLSGHEFLTRSLAWSPDSQYLACSSNYGDDTVQIWNVNTGTTFRVLDTFGAGWLAWSPDGTRLAGARYRPAVEIWDVQAGAQLATVTASDEVSSGTWGLDSGTVIYGTDNSTVATIIAPPPVNPPIPTPTPTATFTPTPTNTPTPTATSTPTPTGMDVSPPRIILETI